MHYQLRGAGTSGHCCPLIVPRSGQPICRHPYATWTYQVAHEDRTSERYMADMQFSRMSELFWENVF